MKKWISKNLNSIIVGSFLIPILLVAFVSISHVTSFYNLANPLTWAIYLSVAVEVAALAALAGVSAKFGKFIYIPFGIVTIIQLIGNFFFSYTWININSKEFKDWVDMVSPILELMGFDSADLTSHRRVLGFLTGGLLPFISLTFAHMLIVYSNKTSDNKNTVNNIPDEEELESISKQVGIVERKKEKEFKPYVPTDEDLKKLESILQQIQKKTSSETEVINTPSESQISNPTSEPIYFVDDQPVIEDDKPTRLVYTKDESETK